MQYPEGLMTGTIKQAAALNAAIVHQYHDHRDAKHTRKTHLFNGRYENIYIHRDHIPALEPVLDAILEHAADQLSLPQSSLRLGFWFNEMQPGDETTLHSHDDDDELFSAVYYVTVPPDSGDLVFRLNGEEHRLAPQAGHYWLFPPHWPHAVSKNNSQQMRLSIGINIGLIKTQV